MCGTLRDVAIDHFESEELFTVVDKRVLIMNNMQKLCILLLLKFPTDGFSARVKSPLISKSPVVTPRKAAHILKSRFCEKYLPKMIAFFV